MLHSGLVSITFRKLPVGEVVALVKQAGLEGIEWGGDVHVPHGDLARAREVRDITLDAGLKTAAYGSYYRVGHAEPVPFESVLDTACELGAPVIRVWPGKQGSDSADEDYWRQVIADARRIAGLAARRDIVVATEYHPKTLTDTNAAAQRLLREAAHPNLKTFWQPPVGAPGDYCLEGLRAVLPLLVHVHAFTWHPATREKKLLAEGEGDWKRYLEAAASTRRDHFVMLEFVLNDDPAIFLKDARTLRGWLEEMV